jgi:hypothetical protein
VRALLSEEPRPAPLFEPRAVPPAAPPAFFEPFAEVVGCFFPAEELFFVDGLVLFDPLAGDRLPLLTVVEELEAFFDAVAPFPLPPSDRFLADSNFADFTSFVLSRTPPALTLFTR